MLSRLQDTVSCQAGIRPSQTALVFGAERVSYGALEMSTNRLARALREAGLVQGDRVAILLPKSIQAVTGMLGALKAGGIYVPLDSASPATRLVKMLESCESRCILAGGSTTGLLNQILELLPSENRPRIGWMDAANPPEGLDIAFAWPDIESLDDSPVPSATTTDDIAHILFTSGSTGTPKGVTITHSNVMHFIEWSRTYFDIQPGDRNSCHSPLHFDLSTFDIFGSFLAGAEVHLLSPHLSFLPQTLAKYVRDSGLTQWFSVPSILKYLAQYDMVQPGDFPALKRLMWCGEAMPTPTLIYWMNRLPHVTFTNLYGPTEATIASSYYTVPECPADERCEIPIGTACDGEALAVLGEEGRPAPPGEIGDLYIRGVGLSPGYWRDPARTAAVFVAGLDPAAPADRFYKTGDLARTGEDGLVYLIGRADTQIKSRGHRIELGEIESALSSIDLVRESAVVAISTDGFEGKVICCAYVPSEGGQATGLQRRLAQVLPAYMIPSRWMPLEKLPLNGNGKTDRRALQELFQEKTGSG